MFSKKLNALMEITKIKNSTLSNAISVDPSYLSRLRTGKRKLPKNPTFLLPMSSYFAKMIEKDEKLKNDFINLLLEDGINRKTENQLLNEIIYNWLVEGANLPSDNNIMDCEHSTEELSTNMSDTTFYYGNDGKQEAYLRFLTSVAESDKVITLLLFSDENMSWFSDFEFTKALVGLLTKILKKGCRINIIHGVERGLQR